MARFLRVNVLGGLLLCAWVVLPAAAQAAAGDAHPVTFWTPRVPPAADYQIDAAMTMAQDIALQGKETIHFVNTTSLPLQTLALTWTKVGRQTLTVVANGEPAGLPRSPDSYPQDFVLAKPIGPGQAATLEVEFSVSTPAPPEKPGEVSSDEWYPRLWWGGDCHNNFEVKLSVPEEYALATSGRLDPQTGVHRLEKAPSFGIWLGRGYKVLESQAGDVPVRCLYRLSDKECAQLLVDTAVDVINFYRERFGFYPYPSLAIVPGADEPMGGYPLGTSIIVIHGMSRMNEKPQAHWCWITAHEIGHQYWGRYVLERDDPGWLWIGMGIHADREYCRARNIGNGNHRRLLARYIEGTKKGLDTTVSRSQEERSRIKFDFNNVVIHGKGFAIISALDCTLGKSAFERICKRCLREFAGRGMGLSEFQSVCEQESGQDLAWFFDQWVNSNKCLSYEIGSQKCEKKDAAYVTEVQVKCLGSLKMPVPVQADFEDGTSQEVFTSRLHDVDTICFESHAPLRQVRLDPEGALAMAAAPGPDAQALSQLVGDLPWVGAGERALAAFKKANGTGFSDPDGWFKLAMTLYDGRYYQEGLGAFGKAQATAGDDTRLTFVAIVWQGHIFDLLGQREKAVSCYQKALEVPGPGETRHDQYHMRVNREWVQERLKEPFRRQ
jgi:tetratricopeptide (TPR) repeat protein